MTFEEILTLDDAALNAAIDKEVYGYTWQSVQKPAQEGWAGEWWRHADARGAMTFSSVPYFHHTATWERTMFLSRAYGVWAKPHWIGWHAQKGNVYDGWDIGVSIDLLSEAGQKYACPLSISCHTDHDERVARCRLALWRSICEQAVAS